MKIQENLKKTRTYGPKPVICLPSFLLGARVASRTRPTAPAHVVVVAAAAVSVVAGVSFLYRTRSLNVNKC